MEMAKPIKDEHERLSALYDYLTKPVERQQLIRVLNRFLPSADEPEEEI